MATVRFLRIEDGPRARPHGEVQCAARVLEVSGERFIQLDTYGSSDRQEIGKQSQSIRLSREAFDQLVAIGRAHFYDDA